MRQILRALCTLLLLAPLAACGDDGTGPDRLTAEQVAGRYYVCALAFTPENSIFPRADILAAGLETSDPAFPNVLAIDAPNNFAFEFFRKGQNIRQQTQGSFSIQNRSVTLDFLTNPSLVSTLLLSDPLRLDFQSSPKSLSTPMPTATSAVYDVPRAEYARLAGISENGLNERIPGKLSATFRAGSCL